MMLRLGLVVLAVLKANRQLAGIDLQAKHVKMATMLRLYLTLEITVQQGKIRPRSLAHLLEMSYLRHLTLEITASSPKALPTRLHQLKTDAKAVAEVTAQVPQIMQRLRQE